ncbi:MAG: YkgJ family cysteine cluster protein [Nitrospirae bacterium]|nr:YkgJ family cysteine cluster protein [Nitrospirota bacterium]
MLSMKSVDPVQLTLNSRFSFKCYKSIGCFTKCCSNIDILLTPYDIIRLKKKLGLSSGEFLDRHVLIEIDEKTSHPFVFLKMNEDAGRSCPFVSPEGCTIYSDRPANCRYYPLGQASLKKMDENINVAVTEEFYFFVKEEHCLGYKEDVEWTVKSWREDQGVDIYDDMNRGWKEILFRRNLPGCELDEKKQKAFYMACYDVDRFRRFVFESRFLETFDIDKALLDKISGDELELMKFGFEYTKYILGIEETLKKK